MDEGSPLFHLVARTRYGARPFVHRRACADLWHRIRRHFDVVACVLMPNHVHLLAPLGRGRNLRSFARILSASWMQMRAAVDPDLEFRWEPVPAPQRVQTDRKHIARTIRYIHLNPVRAGLCGDPLEWEWSTHRDWVGAVALSSVNHERWTTILGKTASGCAEWLHEYVSSDESVLRKQPLTNPATFLDSAPEDSSVGLLVAAIPRVLRSPRIRVHEFSPGERQLFVRAAARWTHYPAAELARRIGRHPTSAQRTLRQNPALTPVEARAVAQVLADPRLRSMPLDSVR